MDIVWMILIGGVAGWLAGLMMRGRSFCIFGNVFAGVAVALVGILVLDFTEPSFAFFFKSLVVTVVILFVGGQFKRGSRSSTGQ